MVMAISSSLNEANFEEEEEKKRSLELIQWLNYRLVSGLMAAEGGHHYYPTLTLNNTEELKKKRKKRNVFCQEKLNKSHKRGKKKKTSHDR